MNNLAIIPARSGSKGLPNKNIKLLNERPLMWYSVNAALESKCFSEVMVSTDSKEYADIAKKCGANVPFLRSEETSSDGAGSWDVVCEVLSEYMRRGQLFDSVCLLQPTSPLRDFRDIAGAYTTFYNKKCDAVTSVCETEHSPMWCMRLSETLSLNEFRLNNINTPRQNLDKYYRLNGAIYIRRINYIGKDIDIVSKNEYAYIMEQYKSVDIDSQLDFDIATCILKQNAKE